MIIKFIPITRAPLRRLMPLAVLLLLGFSLPVAAQTSEPTPVSGQITDPSNGLPLIGVTVLVTGDNAGGTATDVDGNFTVSAAPSDTLIISYTGYAPQRIPVNNRTVINIDLSEDVATLEEVVVTGYGTQKKESVTGSIATIDSEAIGRVKNSGTSASTRAGR